jgi:hypothetical protein
MKLRLLFFICLSIIGFNVYSQFTPVDKGSYRSNFTEGSLLLEENNPLIALEYFKFAYNYDSTNANINYLVGQCYLAHPKFKHDAEHYLEKAILNTTKSYEPLEPTVKKAPVISYYYLAQSYHLDYKFDKAEKMLATYETFLKPKDKKGAADVAYLKDRIKYGKMYYAAPQSVKITNMGDSINDAMPDYSPVLTGDERMMIFTHRGKNNVGFGELAQDGFPYEDVMVCYKKDNGDWTMPVSISPYINTNGHDGAVSLTPDGQTLTIYKDDNGGDLFYSNFDGKDWSMPIKYGSNINSEYWEPSACLSRDGNTLYFVSDRPGGLGGRDIWKCVKLPTGQWSLASNLGPNINTPYDEESPFMGADGITFYFSSKGHQSMGGFDIMWSVIDDDGQFSLPINMEYPINTTDDDLYLVASPDNKRLYYASAHESTDKIFNHGEKDIYMITYDKGMSNDLALFKGQIKPGPCDSLPSDITIVVTNSSSGEIVGTYRPQHVTGAFTVVLVPGAKYVFSYQQSGDEIYTETIDVSNEYAYDEIQKDLKLKPHNLCNGAVMDYDSTKTDLVLNLTVLSDAKTKKPTPNVPFKLYTKDGLYYEGRTGENGKAEKILLEKNHDYDVVLANNEIIKSHFSTQGETEGKVYDKTMYLLNKEKEDIELLLNLVVLSDKKSKKPVKNEKVNLLGTDGSKYEGTTDGFGKITGISLAKETNYEIIASTAKDVVSTSGLKKSKTINKILYLNGSGSMVPDNSEVAGTKFKFYFKYNMNELDEQAPEYITFINNLIANKAASGKIKLSFMASASNVPTKSHASNDELSDKRAKSAMTKIINSLKQKGISESDIEVVKQKSIVSGPAYANDASNTAKYEKFQYIKVEAF